MPPTLDRLLYVDDSGHPQSGLIVYGWVEFAPDRWSSVLGAWLDTRKRLWRDFGIPVTRELHTTDYINGRGRISKRLPSRHVPDGVEHWRDFGHEVARECLGTLASLEGLAVGSVWRRDPCRDFGENKYASYVDLVARLERELAASASLGMVFMDGDARDPLFRTAHRALVRSRRHVIEDAIHLDSRGSHLVQMADLVAWTANAHVDRHAGNEFAWGWYEQYLSQRDRNRVPCELAEGC